MRINKKKSLFSNTICANKKQQTTDALTINFDEATNTSPGLVVLVISMGRS